MKRTFLTFLSCLFFTTSHGQIFYSDAAAEVGIDHVYTGIVGGGVSFFDFNDDGFDDITMATGQGEKLHFYKNIGSGFVKIAPLVPHNEEAKQVLWVDFDNDGDHDLYVATYDGANRLYKNTGNLEFTEVTEMAGLPLNDYRTFGACFGDYDRDGWLDLYYSERIPFMSDMNQHRLFRNNADGTFSETTEVSGAADIGKVPFCSAFFDYNNDRWPDIYTANDKFQVPNTLLENNADGTFTDVSVAANADLNMDAMCVTVGDYNNDGWQDLYITNTAAGSALLHNIGATSGAQVKFGNAAQFAGVGFFGGTGWSSVFIDADNDGDQDLYVSGAKVGADVVSSAFYENKGNSTFYEPDAGFTGDTVISYSNATGDFNNDGYPDIIVLNEAPFKSFLWENDGGDNNWLKIKLQGVLSNRDAIGTKIELYSGAAYQMRYTHCGTGFQGQNSGAEIIGTGAAEAVDSIVITWPSGHIDRLFSVPVQQTLQIVEGSTTNGEITVDPDVEITVNVTDVKNNHSAKIPVVSYPNPARDFLNIETESDDDDFRIIICDPMGRPVFSRAFSGRRLQIDISHLQAGNYYLLLMDSKGKRIVRPWIQQ